MNQNQWGLLLAGIAFTLAAVAGCGDRAAKTPETAKEFPIKATVTAIDPVQKKVKLDHEEIPGLMGAMEMEFSVRDPELLEGVQVGDKVEGTLEKADKLRITKLKKE